MHNTCLWNVLFSEGGEGEISGGNTVNYMIVSIVFCYDSLFSILFTLVVSLYLFC